MSTYFRTCGVYSSWNNSDYFLSCLFLLFVCSCVNVSFCGNSHCETPHTQPVTVGEGGRGVRGAGKVRVERVIAGYPVDIIANHKSPLLVIQCTIVLPFIHQFQFQELHLKADVTETITRPTRTSCHKDQNQNQRGQKLQHLQDFQYSQDLTAAHQVSLFHPFVFLMQRF